MFIVVLVEEVVVCVVEEVVVCVVDEVVVDVVVGLDVSEHKSEGIVSGFQLLVGEREEETHTVAIESAVEVQVQCQ